MSMILKEKSSICVLWTKRQLLIEYQGKCWSVGICNEEVLNTTSFGWISNESV